jgi:hypothetical protein
VKASIAWHQVSAAKRKIRASDLPYGKTLKNFLAAPGKWGANSLESIVLNKETADAHNAAVQAGYDKASAAAEAALATARVDEQSAMAAGFADQSLNDRAKASIAGWIKANDALSKAKAKVSNKRHLLLRPGGVRSGAKRHA